MNTSKCGIERLNDEGFGVGRIGDQEVWVPGSFPGEQVRVKGCRTVGEIALAERLEILEESPRRVNSVCACSPTCTACPLIELDYEAQLEFKQERVQRAIGKLTHQPLEVLRIKPAEPVLGYRATSKLSVAFGPGGALVGLFRWGTHEIVDTTDCPSHHPLINQLALAVRDELNRHPSSRTVVRHAVLRVSPVFGKAMLTLVVARYDERLMKALSKGIQRRVPALVSTHSNVNTRPGPQVFGRETRLIWGHPDLLDQVGSHRVLLSPVSFFQAHHSQAAWIYRLIRSWAELTKSDLALDLYSGVGGIAMSLAEDAGRVLGVEGSAQAASDARRNAELNRLRNCTFRPADASRLPDVIRPGEKPAVACLNPPRSGSTPEVLSFLAALHPRRIIYVSCDPGTLGRDLLLLGSFGYRGLRAQPVDMFPQTAHVETVVLLEPKK